MRDGYSKQTDGGRSFGVIHSKGADGQRRIEAVPDAEWEWTQPGEPPILEKAGFLLVTMGQDPSTARLTAVASGRAYVGYGWATITGLDVDQAKAAAVFFNSTAGRLMLMRQPGKKLAFPVYSAEVWKQMPVPDLTDNSIRNILADCWRATRHEIVPQFRDGYTPVRRRWDEAVCAALGWDISRIAELGVLLACEPQVRGVGYSQWKE